MKVHSLYSTSDGNACRIYNNNNSILIDCGVSKTKLFKTGVFPIDAIFVTHEHSDHASGIGVLGRATGAPIYIHQGVHEKLKHKYLLDNCNIKFLYNNEPISIGDFKITPHHTSHDVLFGFYFTVIEKSTNAKYGHLTDTGTFLPEMYPQLRDSDAILLETNYDELTLERFGGYTAYHKNRIKSDVGHLGIQQTVDFISENLDLDKIQWIALGHLSPRTNDYTLVHERLYDEFPNYEHFHCFPGNTYLEINNPIDFSIELSKRNQNYQYIGASSDYNEYVNGLSLSAEENFIPESFPDEPSVEYYEKDSTDSDYTWYTLIIVAVLIFILYSILSSS